MVGSKAPSLTVLLDKELRLALLSSRFLGCSLLLVVLAVASTAILVQDFEARLDRADANVKRADKEFRDAGCYYALTLELERRPQPLSLFNLGIADRYGHTFRLAGKYDVIRIYGGLAENPLQHGFVPVDFSRIVMVVLSVVALVLSYDLVNGDRAQGTLQMTLAGSVARTTVLVGKYLGALLSTMAPFTVAILLWLLIVGVKAGMSLGPRALAKIGLLFLVSLLYGSVFVCLGLLSSVLTARPATSLIMALLIWTATVVVYPPAVTQAVGLARPLTGLALDQLGEQKSKDEARRDRLDTVRQELLRRAVSQYRIAQTLLRLSPAAAFDFASARLAETDLDAHLTHLRWARNTDDAFRAWQEEKIRFYPSREFQMNNVAPPLDVSDLPHIEAPTSGISEMIAGILPDVLFLLLFNLLLFAAAYVAFLRYDVR